MSVPLSTPPGWTERALAFVRNAMRNFRKLPVQEALRQSMRYSAELAEAPFGMLVRLEDAVSIRILVADEPAREGQLMHPPYYYATLHSDNIVLKEAPPLSRDSAEAMAAATHLLIVPLREEGFTGAMIFGFRQLPEEPLALHDFAQVVQEHCQELIRIQLLTASLESSRQRFDTLLHSVPEGVVLIEENGRDAWVNRSAAALLSLPEGASAPTHVAAAMASLRQKADNEAELQVQMRQLLRSGEKRIEDWPWYFAGSLPRLLHVSCTPVTWGEAKGRIWTFKDATHRLESQQAKGQIRELSTLLTSVLDSSLSGIMAFRAVRDDHRTITDFEWLLVNKTAEAMTGRKAETLLGKLLLAEMPGNRSEGLFARYIRVVETGEPMDLEHFYQHEGLKTWFHSVAVKLDDGFVITFSDITSRKNAEEKLRQSQANLSALVENTSDFIWSIDKEYRLTTSNSAFQEAFRNHIGFSLTTGDKLDFQALPGSFVPSQPAFFERAFRGERFTEEIQATRGEAAIHIEHSFNPIQDAEGNVTGIAVFGRDITRRVRSEQEIRQKSQMLNGILQNMPVVIFRLDPHGNFTEAQGLGLQAVGLQPHEIAGLNAFQLYPELALQIQSALQGQSVTFLGRGMANERKWYFQTYLFSDETTPEGVIGFALDVTERKHIERELKAAKENAEHANQAKSYFLANMSHEIRTPISAILGFAQVLKQQPLSPESQEYLNYIISSGELLLKLIGDVLDLTKIEEGKISLHYEPFHLREVLTSNLHPYQFRAHEKGLQFELAFQEQLPAYVTGDAGKISQVVINLIGNALKFTSQGGIAIHVTCEEPAPTGETLYLRVAVSDTGIGVPPDKQESIFQSFTQADSTINRQFGGSGLGLAIVKELVERMKGTIEVESPSHLNGTPGGPGSTFRFTIPLQVASLPELSPENGQSGHQEVHYQQRLHVLLVDDNEINQRLAGVMLQNMGCKFTVAANGREALDRLQADTFQLVLMDVQMPFMNGYETTRYIREKLALTLPIIGLSANVYKEEIELCYQSGMNDYLSKPYSEKSLREKIIKWAALPASPTDASTQEPASPPSHLTDLTFLTKLFAGDPAAIQEMVTDFINQQRELVPQMEESMAAKDYVKLSGLAHYMRSSISAVGLEALRQPLEYLETTVRDGADAETIQKAFQVVLSINQQAVSELHLSLDPQ